VKKLVFWLEVEQLGERADNAGHLLHARREVIVRARLKVVCDDFVDEG